MEAIEQVVCGLKQLAFTGSALPETMLLLFALAKNALDQANAFCQSIWYIMQVLVCNITS